MCGVIPPRKADRLGRVTAIRMAEEESRQNHLLVSKLFCTFYRVFVCVYAHTLSSEHARVCTCHGVYVKVRQPTGGGSLFPAFGFQGQSSGCQTSQQVLLPAEPSFVSTPRLRFHGIIRILVGFLELQFFMCNGPLLITCKIYTP